MCTHLLHRICESGAYEFEEIVNLLQIFRFLRQNMNIHNYLCRIQIHQIYEPSWCSHKQIPTNLSQICKYVVYHKSLYSLFKTDFDYKITFLNLFFLAVN